MMADFSRVRANDYAIFYVQTSKGKEGKFYGIYQIASDPFLKTRRLLFARETLDKSDIPGIEQTVRSICKRGFRMGGFG